MGDDNEERHITFGDGGHSSASDEDQKAVEVTFDPSNPYRRKSSLVRSESNLPQIRQNQNNHSRTQCIVHQLLESQKRIHHPHGTLDGTVDDRRGHGQSRVQPGRPRSQEISDELGLDKMVEPKGTKEVDKGRVAFVSPHSSEASDVGQVDEHEWRTTMAKPRSQLDAAAAAAASSSAASSASASASASAAAVQGGSKAKEPELHSRLLTKKQLSEMAWGVRELSRRLGSMRLKFKAKTIFLLTKIYDAELVPKTRELTKWLLDKERDVRYTVYVQSDFKRHKKFDAEGLLDEVAADYIEAGELQEEQRGDFRKRLRYWDEEMCRARPHTFDFVITLGGDGTVLYASWLFQRIVPPVLSFSLGSLGFLTKFDFEDYQKTLTEAFQKGVTVSLRLRFEGTVMRSQPKKKGLLNEDADEAAELQRRRDLVEELIGEEKDDEHTHKPDGTFEVLNEIVIDRGPNPTMSSTEIFGDDEHFTSVSADGVCVSTPTGSTAYNLAAGGSLCHPENPVMLVTSICAHTLSFRPIVLPDTVVLRVGVPFDARTGSWASFDGRERVELRPGDYVTISASRYPFASVQIQGRRSEDWVNSIRGKLGWNTRQKQKAYKEWDS